MTTMTRSEIREAYGAARKLGAGDYDLERKPWLWAFHAESVLKKHAEHAEKQQEALRDRHFKRNGDEIVYAKGDDGKPDKNRPVLEDPLAFQKEFTAMMDEKVEVPVRTLKASEVGDLLFNVPSGLWVNLGPLFELDIDSEQEQADAGTRATSSSEG